MKILFCFPIRIIFNKFCMHEQMENVNSKKITKTNTELFQKSQSNLSSSNKVFTYFIVQYFASCCKFPEVSISHHKVHSMLPRVIFIKSIEISIENSIHSGKNNLHSVKIENSLDSIE